MSSVEIETGPEGTRVTLERAPSYPPLEAGVS
jgi:hypothetical protein